MESLQQLRLQPVVLMMGLVFAAVTLPVLAGGIRTDGTAGAAQTLSGPDFVIPQSLGKVVGNNLFQSFHTFGIDAGQSATFQTSVTGNLISRVTGGALSEIHGKLALTASGGNPAFWFINPAGIVFGEGASISVPGAFHAATADYVRLADGSRFYADPASASVFSSAAPEAFGFLGNANASRLAVQDGAYLNNANAPITLAGGDVRIDSAKLENTGGDIRIVALGKQAAEVAIDSLQHQGALGSLQISNAQVLTNTAGKNMGGGIGLAGGEIAVNSANVRASTTGEGGGGGVLINAGSLSLSGDSFLGARARTGSSGTAGNVQVLASGDVSVAGGSSLSSDTYGSGRAGDVYLSAANLSVDGSGSFFSSDTLGAGNAAGVTVKVAGLTKVTNGAWISSDAYDAGNGGTVILNTGRLLIDGAGTNSGISSETLSDSTGKGGWVNVTVTEGTRLENKGRISTITGGSGDAGDIMFSSGSLAIAGSDSGILSDAKSGSLGKAGYVSVTTRGETRLSSGAGISSSTQSSGSAGIVELSTGSLYIESGAAVASSTSSSGSAGNVTVSAGSLAIDGSGTSTGTGAGKQTGIYSTAAKGSSGNAGNISLTVTDAMKMSNTAEISSDTNGEGRAGDITVVAGTLALDNSAIYSRTYSEKGAAGWVDLTARGNFLLGGASKVSSSTYGGGDAGWIGVHAGSLDVTGNSGFYSNALSGSKGAAGWVEVKVDGQARLTDGGQMTSSTAGPGSAGYVSLEAGSVLIDGGVSGLFSTARTGSSGNAGWIDVTAKDAVRVVNGGRISTSTNSTGNAGYIHLKAGTLAIDHSGTIDPNDSTGIFSTSDSTSKGNAGDIDIAVVGAAQLIGGATISSSSYGQGHAGNITVKADSLSLDGSGIYSRTYSDAEAGYAGWVDVNLVGKLALSKGSIISSSTYAGGEGGYVSILADSIDIDDSGIYSNAASGSWGRAGWVVVEAKGLVHLRNFGEIATNTLGAGDAGYVEVVAGSVVVDGAGSRIAARAESGSSGQTGDVTVMASDSVALSNGGSISIANDASSSSPGLIKPTYIYVKARDLSLKEASVTANSTGNIAASHIELDIANDVHAESSVISTSSVEGNGGDIRIQAGPAILLDRSQITTSVDSLNNGNGGNIRIASRYLVMNTGMIQANTAAPKAVGGDIGIEVTALVPNNNALLVGGSTPYTFDAARRGFNSIQAAAPDGISGNIQITSPALDLSGSLAGIQAQILQSDGLGRSPCDTSAGSTLATVGRGGLPPSARESLRADPLGIGAGAGLRATFPQGAPIDLAPFKFVRPCCSSAD